MKYEKALVPFGIFAASTWHIHSVMKAAGANQQQLTHMLLASAAIYGFGVWAGSNMAS